ncbi:MAG: thiamine pyrophosphate-binding protein [Thermoplasmatota archaeon]
MDGGRIVAQELADRGVRTVFTLCGGHIAPIYEGCIDHDIRVIDVRHEQAAAMAADGWSRITGEPGVALVTAGPGVVNAVTGIANAWKADSPIVVIGGQAEHTRFDQGPLQDMHHVDMLRPITKWARGAIETRRLGEYVRTAFREAASPPTGPAFLEIPWDILYDDADPATRGGGPVPAPPADPTKLDEAARWLATAERPVILAGSGIRWSKADAALLALADRARAPIYLNGLARGSLPPGHPRFFQLSRGAALREADLVVNLGGPWDFRLGFGEDINPQAKVIHADVAPARVGAVRAADLPIAGDLASVARGIASRLPPVSESASGVGKAWLSRLLDEEARKRAAMRDGLESDAKPIHALRLARELAAAVDEKTIVIGDGGNVVALAAKVVPAPRPGSWMDPGPFGTLGVGFPFAIAAKAAEPERKVLLIMGDGSFGLNGFEIDTLVRHNLPVVCVVGNDGAWTQIREPQVAMVGEDRSVATRLAWGTRYDKVAEALGGRGWLVEDARDIQPAIQEAFACGKPAVINVLIDPATNRGSGKAM